MTNNDNLKNNQNQNARQNGKTNNSQANNQKGKGEQKGNQNNNQPKAKKGNSQKQGQNQSQKQGQSQKGKANSQGQSQKGNTQKQVQNQSQKQGQSQKGKANNSQGQSQKGKANNSQGQSQKGNTQKQVQNSKGNQIQNKSQNDIQNAQKQNSQGGKNSKLKVIFLGGVGEIGKNMTVLQYKDDIIVIDCGVSFPNEDTPGIDLIIPDVTYLEENKEKVKALILTHGHEDHIGAVPFVATQIASAEKPLSTYGSKLTLGLLANKLAEHNCLDYVKQVSVDDGSIVSAGVFKIEFVRVTHSVAGSFAVSVSTPVGRVFLTGDFKIDHTPKHSLPMNLPRIADIGKEGVLLLLCDSTNIEREGYTLSESTVADTFSEYFDKEKDRRIIVATFSSNVDRLQELFDLAKEHKRKIAVSGRSMLNVIDTASKAGYLSFDQNILVPIAQIEKMQPHSLLILCTGSQGEPMSALFRMAKGENSQIKVTKNDTIIISATPIPGNEKGVYSCINQLYMLGARVVYSAIESIHVSGHAQKEELKLLHSLIMPKFFIPVHGEYRHLKQHAEMAVSLGMSEKNIAIAKLGDVAELTQTTMSIKEKVTSGRVLIDGSGVGDVGDQLLKDRLALSQDGFVVIVCGVENGNIAVRPQVFARGSFYTGEGSNEQTVEDIKRIAVDILASSNLNNLNLNGLKKEIQRQVRKYIVKKFDRSPMVIAVIMSSSLDE